MREMSTRVLCVCPALTVTTLAAVLDCALPVVVCFTALKTLVSHPTPESNIPHQFRTESGVKQRSSPLRPYTSVQSDHLVHPACAV